jgi:hypothetical protein
MHTGGLDNLIVKREEAVLTSGGEICNKKEKSG